MSYKILLMLDRFKETVELRGGLGINNWELESI
jgi:hypothetical protein